LNKAAAASPSPEILFQLGQAEAALGHASAAAQAWRRVALHFPAHPYAGEAALALTFSPQERLQRTRGLLDAGDVRAALAELDALGTSARPPLDASAALLRGEALTALGDDPAADASLAVAEKGPRSIAAAAAFLKAKRLFKSADNGAARAAMADVDARFPTEFPAEEAGYFVGWLDLQGGRFEDAVHSFDTFEQRHGHSPKSDEAQWFRSLALVRLGRYSQAQGALEDLMAHFPRSSLVPQARYWAARCLQLASGPAPRVAERFTQVLRDFPGSFYARLAATRLEELSVPVPALFPDKPGALDAVVPEALSLAVSLANSGLFRDAADEVAWRTGGVHSAEEALRYGGALQSIGEYAGAYAVGIRWLWGAGYAQRKARALGLLYPRAYAQAVEAEAAARKVDPFFVWAIMRRESAFRPDALSSANARGLLQLIPKTIQHIAQSLPEAEPDPDTLYAPAVNIRYATWYLAELLRRFEHPVLAAAAYNASPEAVRRWVGNNGAMPLDLFVEMIPFKETRGYVKQVVADYHVYSALYGPAETQPKLALTVPEPSQTGVSF